MGGRGGKGSTAPLPFRRMAIRRASPFKFWARPSTRRRRRRIPPCITGSRVRAMPPDIDAVRVAREPSFPRCRLHQVPHGGSALVRRQAARQPRARDSTVDPCQVPWPIRPAPHAHAASAASHAPPRGSKAAMRRAAGARRWAATAPSATGWSDPAMQVLSETAARPGSEPAARILG
jgi:hypothetical protein